MAELRGIRAVRRHRSGEETGERGTRADLSALVDFQVEPDGLTRAAHEGAKILAFPPRRPQDTEKAQVRSDLTRASQVGRVGLEPTTNGLKVHCSAN